MKIQIDSNIINRDWFKVSGYLSVYIFAAMSSGTPLSLSDISQATGVDRQKIWRILNHLTDKKILQKKKSGNKILISLYDQKEKRVVKEGTKSEGFDNWWTAYPKHRRAGKQECKRLWSKIIANGSSPRIILESLADHNRSKQWSNPTFICSSLKFLKEERYLQTIDPVDKKENKYGLSVN